MICILHLIFLFSTGVSCIKAKVSQGEGSIDIQDMQLKPSSLSITGFLYNHDNRRSRWVDKVFGVESVYFYANQEPISSNKPVTKDELTNSSKNFKLFVNQDMITHNHPFCSMELLGAVPLDIYGKDDQQPFSVDYKTIGVPAGNGEINVDEITRNVPIKCFYRAVFENWKPETDRSKPNFWSLFVYCPVFSKEICHYMNNHAIQTNLKLQMNIKINLRTQVWENSFYVKLNQPFRLMEKAEEREDKQLHFGICLSIPYVSTDEEKYLANGIMLTEWIRYYSSLGMKVFIYDRDGGNEQFLDELVSKDQVSADHLVYYNYTIRGLLDPSTRNMQWDNNEMIGNLKPNKTFQELGSRTILGRNNIQGVDKTQTLTKCRFDAKAVYGIENILVADFDEFLYCPPAKNISFAAQREFIHGLVHDMIKNNIDQITFIQRSPKKKVDDVRDCLIASSKKQKSFFQW